jgi:hypothetical protein
MYTVYFPRKKAITDPYFNGEGLRGACCNYYWSRGNAGWLSPIIQKNTLDKHHYTKYGMMAEIYDVTQLK